MPVRPSTVSESAELRELRYQRRRVYKLWRADPHSEAGEIRGREVDRLARLWREKRDLERSQEVDRIRKQFWNAHYSGASFKAWRIANSNVAGKGGGIRSSATQGISREAWERHFSVLLGNSGTVQPNLAQVQLPGITLPALDISFSIKEVRKLLEDKRNHKTPGPDGLRIDFLRILRYDDVVCLALANLFSLMLAHCEIPSEWE